MLEWALQITLKNNFTVYKLSRTPPIHHIHLESSMYCLMSNVALRFCKWHCCHGIGHGCCTIWMFCANLDTPPQKKNIQKQQLRHIFVILLRQHIWNFACFCSFWSVARTATTIGLAIFQVLTMSLAYSLR